MRNPFLVVLAVLATAWQVNAQTIFKAGGATESIEPGKGLYSLTLAGYGAPRNGRFSIGWKTLDSTSKFTVLAGDGNALYAANENGAIYTATAGTGALSWKKLAQTNPFSNMAVKSNTIYIVRQGQLYSSSKPYSTWKKLHSSVDLTAIACYKNKIVASTANNQLIQATTGSKQLRWFNWGTAANIHSLTADNERLYVLNQSDSMWYVDTKNNSPRWQQVGVKNNQTYTIHAQQIAVAGNAIYTIDDQQKLYRSFHETDGNLSVRALALTGNNNKTVVLVSMDITGMDLSLTTRVKAALKKLRQLAPEAIFMNASHTHFSPVTQAWTCWGDFCQVPDSNYLLAVEKALVRVVEKALDNRQAGYVEFARGSSSIGVNRRNTAETIHPYDSTLDLIRITDLQHKTRQLIFWNACHPVFQNAGVEGYTLSANFPGVAKAQVEEKTGSLNAMFMQGCGGDINPKSTDHLLSGKQLAEDVLNLSRTTNWQTLQGDINYFVDEINIPVKPWSEDSIRHFREINAALPPGDVSVEKNVRWADLMLRRYAQNDVSPVLPLFVQTINIGNWKLVGLSREVVNEYGTNIRALYPDKTVTVSGYTNAVPSYLPNNWHIEEKLYEGFESFLWYGQPGIPDPSVLTFVIGKIKEKNR